ncbi:MAG TPA: helix-turn-helix transcriptional regulator [Longimicrobiaceae bacterium]|nr:helix-turn-helix transcriptional regulator [Longimicrobiaceae bacterium]HEX5502140.1 helix-turn-helix transcriptional regulator [Thermomicrobiales bacterium]
MNPALTPRELEVARLLSEGARWKHVAAELGIAPRTVRAHVERIFVKIGGQGEKSRAVAVYYARTHPSHP